MHSVTPALAENVKVIFQVSRLCLTAIPYIHCDARSPLSSLTDALAVVLLSELARVYLSLAECSLRSKFGQGRFRSYLLPPGAVGGLYGSGCFHFSNSSSVCSSSNCSMPSVYVLSPSHLNRREASYFLLSRLANVLVRFEESADVHGLSAPDISVDGPVEGELEGAAV